METGLFDYELPPELIAQKPREPRDSSRLMVVHRQSGRIEHRQFRDLPAYLSRPDVMVLNNTKVIPARLRGRRESGGPVELLLLRRHGSKGDFCWEALVRPARRVSVGSRLCFGDGELEAVVREEMPEGKRLVEFWAAGPVEEAVRRLGTTPLPPYIREPAPLERYQTVYARHEGSVAAPTAGLHFSPELLQALRRRGITFATLVLHVGPGTFRPVRVEAVEDHRMEGEYYRLSAANAAKINRARDEGGRVVAVGTTVVRALETIADDDGRLKGCRGWTELFIYPGYRFRTVDVLVTNFHLPRSTLLMLVCAFAGRELILEAYRVAVAARYRFYSFGDAMLIL
ncbi:MAG: tRNA preQ1(34) S-adenosylmethionine ribosyltransferase-isomerase QueA [Clostridia bacterium]|nr:tRNA preQ1(34) S-adenosylmethionine ribosyltransferase-isomerase QueA [Clostridia bacterium]